MKVLFNFVWYCLLSNRNKTIAERNLLLSLYSKLFLSNHFFEKLIKTNKKTWNIHLCKAQVYRYSEIKLEIVGFSDMFH